MAEPNDVSTGNDSDQDFDPSADMLVNDFDDEHTLDEEEALEENSNSSEIDDLQRESEMPIEDLLALYQYNIVNKADVSSTSNLNNINTIENDSTSEQSFVITSQENESDNKVVTSKNEDTIWEEKEPIEVSSNLNKLIASNDESIYDISEGEDDDDDDTPDDNWRRSIQIGPEFQAQISDDILNIKEEEVKNNNLLLWDPKILDETIVENYLKNFINDNSYFDDTSTSEDYSNKKLTFAVADTTLTNDNLVRDDEIALYILLKNNFKPKEALKDKNFVYHQDIFPSLNPWTEDECRLFEDGLKYHSKDFHLVQKNKLPMKTVNEIVNFYYLWKKTERHDIFISKYRFEKKKYSLHPATTDYMDHFLDEQENINLHLQQQQSSNTQSLNTSNSNNCNNFNIAQMSNINKQANNMHGPSSSSYSMLSQNYHQMHNNSSNTFYHNTTENSNEFNFCKLNSNSLSHFSSNVDSSSCLEIDSPDSSSISVNTNVSSNTNASEL